MEKIITAIGIESSANKVAIGITRSNGEILSNVRETYISPPGEGFLPREIAEHHRNKIIDLIILAITESKLCIDDLDIICYTKGPGMGSPLAVGALVARTLSLLWVKPIAHIEMGRVITKCINPVVLYVSGGNTQIIAYYNQKYCIFGETLDMAVGNFLDRIARLLKLSNFPAPGYQIEQMAKKGKNYLNLPYTVKGMDISISGVLTAAEALINTGTYTHEDICMSCQECVFSMLIEITERCMAHLNAKEVLVVGGVGCNLRLQEMLMIMAEERGANVGHMDDRYCVDNGAMIAYTGSLSYNTGYITKFEDAITTQRYRTDEVLVKWR